MCIFKNKTKNSPKVITFIITLVASIAINGTLNDISPTALAHHHNENQYHSKKGEINQKYAKNDTVINIKSRKIHYSNEIIIQNKKKNRKKNKTNAYKENKNTKKQNRKKINLYPVKPKKSATIKTQYPNAKQWQHKKIFQIIKTHKLNTTNDIKQKLIQFYAERRFKPIWIKNNKLTEKAQKIIETLKNAHKHGLNPKQYTINPAQNPNVIDVQISAYALTYIKHALFGYIKEKKIKSVNEPIWKPINILRNLAKTTKPKNYMEQFHPQHPAYAHLIRALNKNNQLQNAKPKPNTRKIKYGRTIKTGQKDNRISQIIQKLQNLNAIPIYQQTTTYTPTIKQAIIQFQKDNNLKPDGVIGRKTINALNKITDVNHIRKLQINIDRLRKLPHKLSQKYIHVNLPEFKLHLVQKNKTIYQSDVIIGRPNRKTPIFQKNITKVVFNPFWFVPNSIATREILPEIKKKGSHILTKRNFYVVNKNGKKINPKHVKWSAVDKKSFPYKLRQKPGKQNALGQIKIAFPNQYSIFMHDTPQKKLFNKKNRALSNGCIRVKNIHELTSKILNTEKNTINKKIQTKKNLVKKLNRQIPIVITYFTAWPDENGKINYYNDIYNYDQSITQKPQKHAKKIKNITQKIPQHKMRIAHRQLNLNR